MSQVAIITGASSGIGLSIANSFLNQGYKTICWDIKAPAESNGIEYFDCDVSSENSVQAAYKAVKDKYGRCDVLVNNCGLQYLSPLEEFPIEKWNQLIGVLLTGTFICSKQVFADMKKNKFGRIINISSVHGKVASPFKAAYVAAKHGVHGLTKVIAIEGAGYGVTANSICPGFVDTPLMRNQINDQMQLNKLSKNEVLEKIFLKAQEIKSLTTPQQVADMAMYLSSESASTITGEAFNVSGGWAMGQ